MPEIIRTDEDISDDQKRAQLADMVTSMTFPDQLEPIIQALDQSLEIVGLHRFELERAARATAIATLKAVREPSKGMVAAAYEALRANPACGDEWIKNDFRAMIDAAIAEWEAMP